MFCFEPMEDVRMGKKRHKPETLYQKYILYIYFNNINVINFISTGAPLLVLGPFNIPIYEVWLVYFGIENAKMRLSYRHLAIKLAI